MKRMLAGIAAIAMIAAGFMIYGQRSSTTGGSSRTSSAPLVLWCVPDAAEACLTVKSPSVRVFIKTPLETEAALASNTKIDAVVTSEAWSQRLANRDLVKVDERVGSTPIVVSSRPGQSACSDAPCLITPATKAALPSPRSLAASIVFALGLGDRSIDDLPSATLSFVRSGGAPASGFSPLIALVQARVVDAAVTTGAEAKVVPGIEIRSIKNAVLQLTMTWLVDDDRLESVSESLKASLITAGWDKPLTPASAGPDSASVVDAYVELNT